MSQNKYHQGKIYKIVSDDATCIPYYGSTTNKLWSRFGEHKYEYAQWKNGKRPRRSSFDVFEKYGIGECKIILVESYKCESKDQLRAREQYYIENNNCVNKYNAFGIDHEKILVGSRKSQKTYRQNHPDIILKQKERYRIKHKQQIALKRQQHVLCECGKYTPRGDISRHRKTTKHSEALMKLTRYRLMCQYFNITLS